MQLELQNLLTGSRDECEWARMHCSLASGECSQLNDVPCVECSTSFLGREAVIVVHGTRVSLRNEVAPKCIVDAEHSVIDEVLGREKRLRTCELFSLLRKLLSIPGCKTFP